MMIQGQVGGGGRGREGGGGGEAAKKEEAFKHAHSGLPLSLGRCLFSYEAGIANSRHLLYL